MNSYNKFVKLLQKKFKKVEKKNRAICVINKMSTDNLNLLRIYWDVHRRYLVIIFLMFGHLTQNAI